MPPPFTKVALLSFLEDDGGLDNTRRLPVGVMDCFPLVALKANGGRASEVRISSIALGTGILWTTLTAYQSATGILIISF